jgi:O-antigen/teichoic acid export membrane protein
MNLDEEKIERPSPPAKMTLRDRLKDIRIRLKGDGVGAMVARGASASFVVRVIGMLVGFGLSVILARVLGAAAYGTYVYASSWVLLVALTAQLGLRESVIRFGASAYQQGVWAELRGISRFANRWILLVSLSSAAVFAFVLWGLSDRLDPMLLQTMSIGSS